jgi:hypothetical protein
MEVQCAFVVATKISNSKPRVSKGDRVIERSRALLSVVRSPGVLLSYIQESRKRSSRYLIFASPIVACRLRPRGRELYQLRHEVSTGRTAESELP